MEESYYTTPAPGKPETSTRVTKQEPVKYDGIGPVNSDGIPLANRKVENGANKKLTVKLIVMWLVIMFCGCNIWYLQRIRYLTVAHPCFQTFTKKCWLYSYMWIICYWTFLLLHIAFQFKSFVSMLNKKLLSIKNQ